MIPVNVARASWNVAAVATLCLLLCMSNGVKAFSNNRSDNVCPFPSFVYLIDLFSWQLAVFVLFPLIS